MDENFQKNKKKLYGRGAWRRKRRAQLNKQPLCEYCLAGYGRRNGKTFTQATVADHITPCTTRDEFFKNKLQSLCKTCHGEKRRTEDRDFHRRKRLLEIKFF